MRKHICALSLGLIVGAVAGAASAQDYVYIPNDNENSPGPSNQAYPFNNSSPMRVQQVFAGSQFAGQTGAVTEIAFRVDEGSGNPFTTTNIDVEIRLCHTTVNPTGMSLAFDDNYGGDVTLVYDGLLDLSSSGSGFDILIDIDDAFVYDGASNLLVEYKVFSGARTTQFDSAGTGLGQGGLTTIDRLWATDANAVTGSSNGDDGYVTRLTFGASGYVLRVGGNCPGTVDVGWSGAAQDNRQQGLVFGANQGSTTIPGGACQGTVLGVQGGVRLVNTFGTGSGSGTVSGQAGTGACGGYLQLVESRSCNTSNVRQIP